MAIDLLTYTNLDDYFLIPDNKNLTRKTRAKIFFQRCPNTNFFCSSFTIPDMTIQPVEIGTSSIKSINEVGDHFNISPMNFELLIDEDFEAYLELMRWFQYSVRNGSVNESYSNAMVVIYNSELKPIISIQFFYTYIISLGSIEFNTSEDEVAPLPVSMNFLDMEIEKISSRELLFKDIPISNQIPIGTPAFNRPYPSF